MRKRGNRPRCVSAAIPSVRSGLAVVLQDHGREAADAAGTAVLLLLGTVLDRYDEQTFLKQQQ